MTARQETVYESPKPRSVHRFGVFVCPEVIQIGSLNGDMPVSSAQAAFIAHVGVHVISNWRNKGLVIDGELTKLPVVDRDRLGAPRHRVADVLAFEKASRRSVRSHRRLEPVTSLEGRRVAA